MRSLFLSVAAGIIIVATALPAQAVPSGAVVVAKTSGNALVVWQATQFVAAIASKNEPQAQGLAEVEAAGLQIVAARKKLLAKASSVSLKVLCVRTALQNDAQYAASAFAGFQQLLILTITRSALDDSAKWPKIVDPQRLPPGVSVTVTGKIGT